MAPRRPRNSSRAEPSRRSFEWLVYLALAVPITILMNLAFINLSGPDDFDHVKRAYTVFQHPVEVVTSAGHSSGAMVDTGLSDYFVQVYPIIWHGLRDVPNYRQVYARVARLHWSGREAFSEMPTAVGYLPALYVPQALALEAGKASGASIERSVRWARFANGFVAIALAALGLSLLPAGRSVALVLLLLPRTLLSFASNSADPILFGLALVILALGLRASRSDRAQSALTSAATFVASAVRPPMAALALPALVRKLREGRWTEAGIVLAGVLAAAGWVIAMMPRLVDLRCPGGGSVGTNVAAFAVHWPGLVVNTLHERGLYFFASFVGHYGLGNALDGEIGTPLPNWVYATVTPLLFFAIWQDVVSRSRIDGLARLSLAASGLGYILLTIFAMYVSCTAPGQAFVNGIQGRYLVPAFFALAAAVGGLAPGRSSAPRAFTGVLILWVGACAIAMIADAGRIYAHFA